MQDGFIQETGGLQSFGLTRRFGSLTAVEDLTLSMPAGEILGFLGPNGAGKTTTIRMLAGIIAPTDGYAVVAGIRPDKEPEELHEHIGLLTEAPGFYDRLSARANLEFFARLYSGLDAARQADKYLRLIGLWDRRDDRVGTYSKGMKQRLALARALLSEPAVLLLDEPTAGLDPEAALEVRELIQGLSEEGRAIFLSTHLLAEAEQLCSRVAVFRTRLLALDTPDNLRGRLFTPAVTLVLSSGGASPATIEQALAALPFVLSVSREDRVLELRLRDPEAQRPDIVQRVVEAGGRIESITEERHTLEDIYLSLVRDQEERMPDGKDGSVR